MKEIQIRPIRKEDIPGLNEIRRQPAVKEKTLGLPSERIERTEEFFNRLGPDDHVFVAVTGNTVVGIGALFVNSGKLRHTGRLVLMVHGDFHNKGIGSSLLNTLVHLADHDLGLIRLELDVVVDNEPAIHLYKKSAERPLSDVPTGAPRNENRFASLNKHRTKKKRLAFSRTLENLP